MHKGDESKRTALDRLDDHEYQKSMRYILSALTTLTLAISLVQPTTAQTTAAPNVSPPPGYVEPKPVDADAPLIEQQRPEILGLDIPAASRADLSTCRADATYQLDDVIKTCWPLLQAAKLFTRLDFAAHEAKESLRRDKNDIAENKTKALALATELVALIGEPEYPLEHYYLMKSYETKAHLHNAFGEYQQALDAVDKRIALLIDIPVYDMEFHLAFAHHNRSQYLLELGRRAEARQNFKTAFPLLFTASGYKNGWPISNHSETIIIDALRSGDHGFALEAVNSYLAATENMEKGMQFGLTDHIDLKLYILAGRGDVEEVVALINERNAQNAGRYSLCPNSDRYFPYVLAPLHKNPKIAEKLSAMKCSAKSLAKMDAVAGKGIFSYGGKTQLLPPRSETRTLE